MGKELVTHVLTSTCIPSQLTVIDRPLVTGSVYRENGRRTLTTGLICTLMIKDRQIIHYFQSRSDIVDLCRPL